MALVMATISSQDAHATTYEVRAMTTGRTAQYLRTDRTIAAPRLLTQGLTLGAYDLLDQGTGSLNARVSVRYTTDLGLQRDLRELAPFVNQFNDIRVDIAMMSWRPSRRVSLTLGRHWSVGALGVRDFDGITARFSPKLSPRDSMWFELSAGRDAQLAFGALAPDAYDVQGIPLSVDVGTARGFPWLMGGRIGYRRGDTVWVDAQYQRRMSTGVERPDDRRSTLGDERVGAAATWAATPRLNVDAAASYNTLLGALDRAHVTSAWRPGTRRLVFTAGLERRRPWFDSSSIFNLFGANPYDGAYVTAQRPVLGETTLLEARLWGRSFHGDERTGDLGFSGDDAQAFGGALAHTTRARVGSTLIRWSSQLSMQAGAPGYGGDQVLLDTHARVPVLVGELFYVHARVLGVALRPEHHRHDDAFSMSAIAGLDLPVAAGGLFSILLEQQLNTRAPNATNVYFSFEVSAWR